MMCSLTPQRGVYVEADHKGLAVSDKAHSLQMLLEILKVQAELHGKEN